MKIKTVIGLTKRVALLGLVLGVSMTSCGKKDQQGQQQQAAPQIGFITVTKSVQIWKAFTRQRLRDRRMCRYVHKFQDSLQRFA